MLRLAVTASFMTVITVMVWQSVSGSDTAPTTHPDLDVPHVVTAAQELERALEPGTSLASLQEAALRASSLLGPDHYATAIIRRALDVTTSSDEPSSATQLRESLQQVHESLAFRLLKEAPLPAGYPQFTPLHHAEVKHYPRCRAARTVMSADWNTGENSAFFSLFNHIRRNEIAMTVPVQIDYGNPEGSIEKTAMSFLYERPDMGTAGSDPRDTRIKVVDVPAQMVVSTGVRGAMTEQAALTAREQLLDWLDAHADRYTPEGEVRTLGYNSPFVPRSQHPRRAPPGDRAVTPG